MNETEQLRYLLDGIIALARKVVEAADDIPEGLYDHVEAVGYLKPRAEMKQNHLSDDEIYGVGVTVNNLCMHLNELIDLDGHSNGCNGTLDMTEEWLKDNVAAEEVNKFMQYIQAHGGYCDCEVLLNVWPWLTPSK